MLFFFFLSFFYQEGICMTSSKPGAQATKLIILTHTLNWIKSQANGVN